MHHNCNNDRHPSPGRIYFQEPASDFSEEPDTQCKTGTVWHDPGDRRPQKGEGALEMAGPSSVTFIPNVVYVSW